MYLGSLPELHLMAFGWMLYDNLWALLTFVGLAMFPFAWTISTTMYDAIKRYGITSPDTPIAAFHSVFPSFILMMGIYALACIPTVPLQVADWEYTKICTVNGVEQPISQTMTPGNTGTPADAAQLISGALRPIDAEVPILWDVIMRIGAGVSRALNSGGACPNNTSYLDKELRNMSFSGDPALQAELGQFVHDCFLPARGRFMRAAQNGTLNNVPTVNDAVNPDQYFAARFRDWRDSPPPNQHIDEVFSREKDPDYIGSRFYLDTPGLYAPAVPGQYHLQVDTLKASVPIAGWSYEPGRDCQRHNAAAGNFCTNPSRNSDLANNYGSPTCDEWWSDPNRGLQQKLVQAAEASNPIEINNAPPMPPSEALSNVIVSTTGENRSDQWFNDKIIATTLVNDVTVDESVLEQAIDVVDKVSDVAQTAWNYITENPWSSLGKGAGGLALTGVAVKAGAAASAAVLVNLALNAVDFYTVSWIVKHAYPIAQAYLQLFFIAMLPFILIGSMYDIGRLLQAALLFLAIQFLSPWRFVVEYLDERLFEIMFPEASTWGTDMVLKMPERILLDIVTTSMYTILPFILLWLVALAGADAAQSAGQAFKADNLSKLTSGTIKALGGLNKKKERK